MSQATPGATTTVYLTDAPQGLEGIVTVQLQGPLPAETAAIVASPDDIVEAAQDDDTSNYAATRTLPELAAGVYRWAWDDPALDDLIIDPDYLTVSVTAFTYDASDLSTDLGRVRFELGDTDPADPIFSDGEIQYKLDEHGSVLIASAELATAAYAKYARGYDFTTDGQSFKRSQRVQHYLELAVQLRYRASGGGALSVVEVDRDRDETCTVEGLEVAGRAYRVPYYEA